MRSIIAIFIKQAKDILKNFSVLIQFALFPVVTLVMTRLVAAPDEYMPNNMFVVMMAPVFAGMGLVSSMSAIISEDFETKSLRLLAMAGVKPHEYLIGVGGFILFAGTITSVVFALIGDFTAIEFAQFVAIMVAGVTASIILGATIGILASNRQSAAGLALPIALVLGFAPMIAQFHDGVRRVAVIFHTYQMTAIIGDGDADIRRALVIVGINILVMTGLFAVVYKKKGFRG